MVCKYLVGFIHPRASTGYSVLRPHRDRHVLRNQNFTLKNTPFVISFTVQTTPDTDPPNAIYRIKCTSGIRDGADGHYLIGKDPINSYVLVLFNCGNDQVRLDKTINLPLVRILL